MSVKAATPKGTRDFLPQDMHRRQYIVQNIASVFQRFGFAPIETPAMENLQTLTGKYGEEGDRLIFKILNSGEFLAKADAEALADGDSNRLLPSISEKALRYDLTVPFARFVVQHQNNLSFPFKRYQIQPVWRADRPQKGRFREFYQCDADVVGSESLLQELEFVRIYQMVFSQLQLPVVIRLNNRKILAALAEHMGISDRLVPMTVALDKLDKIGLEGVLSEMQKLEFPQRALDGIRFIAGNKGEPLEVLDKLQEYLGDSDMGKEGVEELRFIIENSATRPQAQLEIDLSLARGLDYYTGCIFEVAALGVELGSIGGGGRYSDLTGVFGKKDLPGVGISFGLDRIALALEELELYPSSTDRQIDLLFINFGEREGLYSLQLANELRSLGVCVEVYPESAKMKKQLDYANKLQIPFVVLIGSAEMQSESYQLKNMQSGEQTALSRIELLNFFKPSRQHTAYGAH